MSLPSAPKPPMKNFDPVFVIMLVAVLLAVASSFTLRFAVGGFGPAHANAAEASPLSPSHLPLKSHPASAQLPGN